MCCNWFIMADGEEVAAPVEAVEEKELDILSSLQVVLKKALANDGLHRGIREAVKALERRQARLVILAEDCDKQDYQRLIEALAHSTGTPLIKVPERAALGEWAGLNRFKKSGELKKAISSSVVAVSAFGEDSEALHFTLDYIKKNNK